MRISLIPMLAIMLSCNQSNTISDQTSLYVENNFKDYDHIHEEVKDWISEMINLNVLNLVWDNKKKRLNSDFVRVPKAGIRTLKQEKNVLMEPKDVNQNIYYMFRDVHAKIDEKFFRKNNVRFDVTVIPPYKVGKEEIKTLGHYHPYLKGKRISYPEIYEVLHGEGMFLLQKKKILLL